MNLLEGYTFIKKLGAGATSDVYLAKNPVGELRALKVFNQMLPEELGTQAFTRELQNLTAINNEKIVKVYGLEKNNEGAYVLIQEYINGGSLKQYLSKITCPIDRLILSLVVSSEILSALEDCHKKGIIHRDIKPENILIDKSGRLVITDFGLSKNLNVSDKTLHGNLFGSPQYMSLLQFSKENPSQKMDIYSITILCYEILTGQQVYSGDNLEEILRQKREALFKSPHRLNSYTPLELSKAIKAILSNDFSQYSKSFKLRYLMLELLDKYDLDTEQIIKNLCLGVELTTEAKELSLRKKVIANLEEKYLNYSSEDESKIILSQLVNLKPEKYTQLVNKKSRRVSFWVAIVFVMSLVSYFSFDYFSNLNSSSLVKNTQVKIEVSAESKVVGAPKENVVTTSVNKKNIKVKKVSEKIKPTKVIEKAPKKNPAKVVSRKKKKPKIKRPKVSKIIKVKKKSEEVKVAKVVPPPIKTGLLIVNVPSDIQVFINNKRVLSIGRRLVYPIGNYNVRLSKVGFDPINSVIKITEGKETLINLD